MKQVYEAAEKRFGRYPEKILQFGEGNFLRAFVDWMVDKANARGVYQGSIVVCQAIPRGLADQINSQHGMYTVILRGREQDKPVKRCELVTSISRCINPYRDFEALMDTARSPELEIVVSNTTEAGISYHAGDRFTDCPPASFPAKLCRVLYERFAAFGGCRDKGLLILPVELIDDNGTRLRELVLRYAVEWKLGADFECWVREANCFANTLVDRIVTGYPGNEAEELWREMGYEDRLMTAGELFNLWVIEAGSEWRQRFPAGDGKDVNIIWTDCAVPYKKRKVRILNGSHTAVVPAAYIAGYDTVDQFLRDMDLARLEHDLIFEEIIPSISGAAGDLIPFAVQVEERFRNPFITHYLADIQLNSCSKFCARCLPTILEYREKTGALPERMVLGLACLLRYLKVAKEGGCYVGLRENKEAYAVHDDQQTLEFFAGIWSRNKPEAVVKQALSNTELWDGRNLLEVDGLCEAVAGYLDQLERVGVMETIRQFTKDKEKL